MANESERTDEQPREENEQPATQAETPVAEERPIADKQAPSPSSGKGGMVAVIIIIVIILLIGVEILVFFGAKKYVGNITATTTSTPVATTITPLSSATAISSVVASTSQEVTSTEKQEGEALADKQAKGMSGPGIESVKVTDTVFYKDASGTIWMKYTAVPTPVNAADPATGVLKKPAGGEWIGVDFGTAGLASGLPQDVVSALGL